MIDYTQIKEIRNYLLTKKLPIDILLEVQDHFISQISTIQQEEDLDFTTAFTTVKESWRKELTLSWKGEGSLMDSTDLMRKMRKQIYWENFRSSLKLTIPYILMLFVIANFTNSKVFQIFFIVSMVVPFLFAAINYIKNYKDFRLPKKVGDHILTLHQDGVLLFFLVISPFINVLNSYFNNSLEFQKMFSMKLPLQESYSMLITFLSLLLMFGGISYSLVCQKKYLQQIKIVKPFLKYLEKNS